MTDVIYIERAARDHFRTQQIVRHFPKAQIIECERYGEVFNRRAQNFRLQKKQPALILAIKHDGFVLPAPNSYNIGGDANFYFSHMMNCIYDCRYCFLQGMYRSAHHVLFVNYEEFFDAIAKQVNALGDQTGYFFSGYDCDSLALEPMSGFIDEALPTFEKLPTALLELRTKSTQIRSLLERKPLKNVVAAFSLSPQNIITALEAKTPNLQKRIDAIVKLQEKGWQIGLRFDPLIYHDDFRHSYDQLFKQVFSHVDASHLHSVSLGGFRMPQGFFQNMVRLYPREPLFAGPLTEYNGLIRYEENLESVMMDYCTEQLLKHIKPTQLFPCH